MQSPACLPPCFWSGMGQQLGCSHMDQGSVCRGMRRACPLVMSMLCPPTSLQLRGQMPPPGTEIRMLSPSRESGHLTRTLASQRKEQSFPGNISLLLPAYPLGTSGGSPGCRAGNGSCGPGEGVVAPAQQQRLSCTSSIRQTCSSWSQQPGWCPIPCCWVVEPPQPRGEQGSTVCLKGDRACAGHPSRGPAVQAALAGTGALCSEGELDPRRTGSWGRR